MSKSDYILTFNVQESKINSMIDRISCLLVSFVDAQSKLDHAVDPLGVHSRLLIQGFNLHDSKKSLDKQRSQTSRAKPEERRAVSKSNMTRSFTDLSLLSASTRCLRFSTAVVKYYKLN